MPQRPAPPPMYVDGVRMFGGGTLVWAIATIVITVLWLTGHVPAMWFAVCVAGVVVGLAGLVWATAQRNKDSKE